LSFELSKPSESRLAYVKQGVFLQYPFESTSASAEFS